MASMARVIARFLGQPAPAGLTVSKGPSQAVSVPKQTDIFFHVKPCGSQALELVGYPWGQMLSWV